MTVLNACANVADAEAAYIAARQATHRAVASYASRPSDVQAGDAYQAAKEAEAAALGAYGLAVATLRASRRASRLANDRRMGIKAGK